MKSFTTTILMLFALMLLNATLQAQGVYVTPGAKGQGPVFSDKPQSGSREVTLKPLNVVAPEPASRPAEPAPAPGSGENMMPEFTVPAYRSFSIVSPEDNGSAAANTALFEVRVAVDPPLQLGAGHAFVVSINGRPVGQRFTATEFVVPPEFWGDTLPPANQSMQLDASIVDAGGEVIKKARPIRFFMRYVTILNNPRRPVPLPLPISPPHRPLPQTKPALVLPGRQ